MALSGWSTSNYIGKSSALLTAVPLTMACWFNVTASPGAGAFTLIDLHASGSNATSNNFKLQVTGTSPNISVVAQTSGSGAASSGASTGVWAHGCSVFSAINARAAFLNGANKGTNAASQTPTGINQARIGIVGGSAPGNAVNGRIAEAAIWNVALSDDEVAALGKGFSPRLIRPSALVAYLPIIRDFIDVKGAGFSVTGSLTVADHCAIRG